MKTKKKSISKTKLSKKTKLRSSSKLIKKKRTLMTGGQTDFDMNQLLNYDNAMKLAPVLNMNEQHFRDLMIICSVERMIKNRFTVQNAITNIKQKKSILNVKEEVQKQNEPLSEANAITLAPLFNMNEQQFNEYINKTEIKKMMDKNYTIHRAIKHIGKFLPKQDNIDVITELKKQNERLNQENAITLAPLFNMNEVEFRKWIRPRVLDGMINANYTIGEAAHQMTDVFYSG